jgi:hypothetical protein
MEPLEAADLTELGGCRLRAQPGLGRIGDPGALTCGT